jgi:MOSC domain-containing protein YiiM
VTSLSRIFRISISDKKGDKKWNVPRAELRQDFGIIGDAHAGSERQVSLLPLESFAKVEMKGLAVSPGEFAENLTTLGLDFSQVAPGKRLIVGKQVELEITQIGKRCHHGCYIRTMVGDCIMPREGIFARVVKGGTVREGDIILWKH